MRLVRLFFLLCLPANSLIAATYYVATNGSDTAVGAIDSPFATVQRAQTTVKAGDTVLIRGGTYPMSETQIANSTAVSGLYAYVTDLTKSGTADARINYWAYPGEHPIFDYTNVKPTDQRVVAFHVSGSWIHIRGLEITGVQVTILTHTQSECFENDGGSNNIYEQCSMHDGMGIGFYLTRGSNNLVLNCDAYRNWDSVSEGGIGGNVDGFGGHPSKTTYTGNIFRGCRAWFNSDDGYDCINAYTTITFENCWAFFNGYTADFVSRGDGNGFKAGGYGAGGGTVPSPIPRHAIRFCLSVRNKVNGFYSNHHVGGSDWISNTAYQNSTNYNMLSTLADNDTDVPGYGHVMKNNLGFSPRSASVSNLDQTTEGANDLTYNFFTLPATVSSADFASVSTNTATLEQFVTQPRKADGSLPDITLLHLVSGSDLINVGTGVGFPYAGAAPDLGAFEFGSSTGGRALIWKGDDTTNAWDLNTTANWLNGTLVAKFGPTDTLVFDDSGSASPMIALAGNLWPGSVVVNSAKDYIFGGSGTLNGAMTLTKNGSGTLTINTANTFTGGIVVNGGMLIVTSPITGNLTIAVSGKFNGPGIIKGALSNAGTIALSSGMLTVSGNVVNSGTLRVTNGAGLAVGGTFTNAGLLDLMTTATPVPANLVNTGIVLTASSVKVQSVNGTGSSFSLTIQSYAGHNYQLQHSSALNTGSWSNLGIAQIGNDGILTFTDPNPNLGKGFYRILVSP